jgi:hypothetical protein
LCKEKSGNPTSKHHRMHGLKGKQEQEFAQWLSEAACK